MDLGHIAIFKDMLPQLANRFQDYLQIMEEWEQNPEQDLSNEANRKLVKLTLSAQTIAASGAIYFGTMHALSQLRRES